MRTPTKLLIYMALWKRPEITEICFLGVNRLRDSGLFPIEAFAVLSEVSMIPLCEKYNIGWCWHENKPVGRKKNYGLSQAYKLDWDYLIEIGSDDVLKTELLKLYAPYFGVKDFLGINHFAYVDSKNGDTRAYRSTTSFGLGRAFSRKVLDTVGTDLWPDGISKGLDNNSTFLLARKGILETRIKSEVPLAIDIKGEDNIWSFEHLASQGRGKPYDLDLLISDLSDEEKIAIKELCHSIQEDCQV